MAKRNSTTRVEKLAEKLGYVAGTIASRVRRRRPTVTTPAPRRKARSGGAVDAPGKKHRKPAPAGPPAAAARTRNARVRAATPTAKMVARRARQA